MASEIILMQLQKVFTCFELLKDLQYGINTRTLSFNEKEVYHKALTNSQRINNIQ